MPQCQLKTNGNGLSCGIAIDIDSLAFLNFSDQEFSNFFQNF